MNPTRLRRAWAGLLLFCAVWVVLPCPIPGVWYLTVVVPEVGHLLALLAVPLLLTRKPEALVGLLAAGLALLPWWQAWGLGSLTGVDVPAVTPRTFEYRPGLLADVYPGTRSPKVVFVHGGSWQRGSRGEHADLLRHLSGQGWEVWSVDYRLAPEHPYPAALEDLRAAVARAGSPVVVMGRSAGGHLALLTAYTSGAAGAIGLYPAVDMTWSHEHPSNPAVLDSRAAVEGFMGGPPEALPERYREASPLRIVAAGAPPTLLIHGDRDDIVFPQQSAMLAERLAALEVPCRLLRLPWANHGGDVLPNGPTGRLAASAIREFLGEAERAHLAAGAGGGKNRPEPAGGRAGRTRQ